MTIYNLALAYEHTRRYDEALDWVRKGLAIDPKDVSLQRLDLRIHILRWRAALVRAIKRLLPWSIRKSEISNLRSEI